MKPYPFLKKYSGPELRHVALPLGGIGTGTVSLGGRGDLRDWEIMNSPAKTFTPTLPRMWSDLGPFFAIQAELGGRKYAKVLEGPLDDNMNHPDGMRAPSAHFPRFRGAEFRTAYPLAELELTDEAFPLVATLQAMNPFIPGNSADSGLPVAQLRWNISNPGAQSARVSLCGTLLNHIGVDGRKQERTWGGRKQYLGWKDNRTAYREAGGLRGLYFDSLGVDPRDEAWGSMALCTWGGGDAGHRTAWAQLPWGDMILDFWDEFSETGRVTERSGKGWYALPASLASRIEIPPGETRSVSFALTWHFPNRRQWHPRPGNPQTGVDFTRDDTIGNLYTTRFADAWDAAARILPRLPELEKRTLDFVSAFIASPAPAAVKEAALFNASTLRTQVCFRTPDGHFFGWEGIHDFEGSCMGSCSHVWNYEHSTGFLFGDLARSMREMELLWATNDEGAMRFRVRLPLTLNAGDDERVAAADAQMGAVLKLYREYTLCGDVDFLRRLWPAAKRALSFAWVEGGWDEDKDGVMEGCQHNTMDVEYFGPNPEVECWYLAALKAAAVLAPLAGDAAFGEECLRLFERGSAWTDANLWNGEYYEQKIYRAKPKINRFLRHPQLAPPPTEEPILQLGRACLADQLVGQAFASLVGLGYLLKPDHVRTTLKSILKYNRKSDFSEVFTPFRLYVLPDEPGIILATWPKGERPKSPFPYLSEVWTGFEHLLATHLMLEGMADESVSVVTDVRRRQDGRRRNPYSESECGHHYARAMAAWGTWVAACGFRLDAPNGALHLSRRDRPTAFTWGGGWGTWTLATDGGEERVLLEIHEGQLELREVLVDGKPTPFTPRKASGREEIVALAKALPQMA